MYDVAILKLVHEKAAPLSTNHSTIRTATSTFMVTVCPSEMAPYECFHERFPLNTVSLLLRRTQFSPDLQNRFPLSRASTMPKPNAHLGLHFTILNLKTDCLAMEALPMIITALLSSPMGSLTKVICRPSNRKH
jgi:hypothetical protein